MPKLIFYVFVSLLLVVSCECKDMHVRRMPEEKDIAFKGEVKTNPSKKTKTYYVPNESREIQLHLDSSDEEAKDAQFKILSWEVADGKKGTLDTSSIRLGNNTLAYTPQEPGTHELTLKVAVEGEEGSAQILPCTIEAPAAEWQVAGHADNTGNIALTIANAPEEWRSESWRITNSQLSEGLEGRIEPTELHYGENQFRINLDQAVLTEPYVLFTLQGPDTTPRTCRIDLTALCRAQLSNTMSEEENASAERLANVNQYIQETEASYHLPPETVTDPRANRTKQEEIATLLGRLTAFQTGYEENMEAFSSNLETLEQTQVNENLAVFEANNKRLKDAIASLKSAQVQLQQRCATAEEALFKSLRNYNEQAIETLLEDPNIDINRKDSQEATLLHLAIEKGNVNAVSNLLKLGANVEEKEDKYTPLQRSIVSKDSRITRLLIEHGADLYAHEKHCIDGTDVLLEQFAYPPFLLACLLMYNEVYEYSENESIDDGWLDLIRILIEAGVDLDMRYEQLIPVQAYIERSSLTSTHA